MIDTSLPPASAVDPAHASRLGLRPAHPGIRSIAFAIDATLWLALLAPAVIGAVRLGLGLADMLAVLLLAAGVAATVVFTVVQLLSHGRRGVTAGKAMMRLRSVRLDDLGRPGFWRIVLRALVLWGGALVLVIVGPAVLFASGLWDPQRRGRSWLDMIAGCWLIDARGGLDPLDVKALRHARRSLREKPDDLDERLPSLRSGAPRASGPHSPEVRSRAGVVGGGTGATWDEAHHTVGVTDGPPAPSAILRDAAPVTEVPGGIPADRGVEPSWPTAEPSSAVSGPRRASFTEPTVAPDLDDVVPPVDAPRPSRRSGVVLRLDDGQVLRVPRSGLIGRQPAADPDERVDAVIALDDPARELSKTHLGFGADEQGVWVVDRGSSNGTHIVAPGGEATPLRAGETVRVPVGATVRIGGRHFTVARRGEA